MFKIKNVVMALVFSCVILFTIPQIAASTVQFDNSDFVSEMTSEEKEELEIEKKEEEYQEYQELMDMRTGYVNFGGVLSFEDDEAFKDGLQSIYNNMDANTKYNEQQKNDYYNAVIGDEDTEPGIMYSIYDFSNVLKMYRENENIVVDCTEANQILEERGAPRISINNLDYINELGPLLNELQSSFKELDVRTTPEEELVQARESNVIFSTALKTMQKEFAYLSIPKVTLLSRITNSVVIMNIGLLLAIVILFIVRFPIVKKQQEYAWNSFKPLTLLTIPIVALVFFVFLTWFLDPDNAEGSGKYDIYVNGVSASTSDRIYQSEPGGYKVTLITTEEDMAISAIDFDIIVTDDAAIAPSADSFPTWQYGSRGLTTFKQLGNSSVILPVVDDKYTYTTINSAISQLDIEVVDKFSPDKQMMDYYVDYNRNQFILPMGLRLIIPSLLFGTLFFMFLLMPKPMVKTYLNELYTINKFCGFLSYNMAYRSNARVLIEETLQSLDSCKFAEDFAIIFFEKDRSMTDKIQDISQIYSYKFFEMYLGIVNIIFDEGVSDSTLKSLSIIQQFGDEYYNQADMFFKSKSGAISALMMIIAICVALPVVVKTQSGAMFALYLCTADAYTATLGSYLVWFGLVCVIYNMYKDNKIVRAEGRYA